MAEYLEVGAVGPAAKHHPLPIGLAGVEHRVAKPVDHGLAVAVMHPPAGIAEVEVEPPVGADHEGMHGVVVLWLADLRE